MFTRYLKGLEAENIAVGCLIERGFSIIARRYVPPSRRGEIDIIAAAPDGSLHFFEVRSGTFYNLRRLFSSITPKKVSKIIRSAGEFLFELNFTPPKIYFWACFVIYLDRDFFEIRCIPLD